MDRFGFHGLRKHDNAIMLSEIKEIESLSAKIRQILEMRIDHALEKGSGNATAP